MWSKNEVNVTKKGCAWVKKIKICIVGCGAIGSWLGVHLGRCPQVEVSCLVRPSSVKQIRATGLRVDSPSPSHSSLTLHPKLVSDNAHELGIQDWIILSVKATSFLELVPELIPMLSADTAIWTAMNGVPWWFMHGLDGPFKGNCFKTIDPNNLVQQSIPLHHWVGGVVHASCSLIDKGHAMNHFGKGLLVGEPTGGPTQVTSSRVQAFTELLTQAGFDASASTHIQKDIWYKLWGNMTMNPISALTGATIDKILEDPLLREFVSGVMIEAKEIGSRIGLPIQQTPEDRHAVTAKLGAVKTSMLQDIESLKPLELDVLLSAVLEIASWIEASCPLTSALLGLTRVKAQTLGLYKNQN